MANLPQREPLSKRFATFLWTNMRHDAANMSAIAVLEEIDTLPAAERRARIRDGNRQRDSGERSLDVRGHVFGTLGIVRDPAHRRRIGRRDQSAKELFQIPAHGRVGILLNAQRTGRMLNEQRQQPFLHRALLHEPSHVLRELIKCRACGSNDKDRLHRTVLPSADCSRQICALPSRRVNWPALVGASLLLVCCHVIPVHRRSPAMRRIKRRSRGHSRKWRRNSDLRTSSRRRYVLSPESLRAEAENAVPVSTRRARAEVSDALPVESIQFHVRRGGGELLKQRFGLVPALAAEVR